MSELVEPPVQADERATLEGYLAQSRALVRWKLANADDEALRGVATASGLTAHGVLSHLTNVERWWWRDVFEGQDGLAYDWTDDDPDGEFHLGAARPLAQLLQEYVDECARCDEVLARVTDLGQPASRRPVSVRWVLLHMVVETSRHLGHLDVLREQADGSVGDGPWKSPSG